MNSAPKYGLVIHGGAGAIHRKKMTTDREQAYRSELSKAVQTGYDVLSDGGSGIEAVQKAINVMENSPLFNAGKGAVFTHDGHNEQDATIMDGSTLQAGSIAGVAHIKNPIDIARLVMEKSQHVLLIGDGAESFAKSHGMDMMAPEYFFTDLRWQQLQKAIEKERIAKNDVSTHLDHDGNLGTVGAVAYDKGGNLAAATSSGGMTNKRFGRVGDSAIVGAGTYANNRTCAVSTTGHGEFFMRGVTAYDVSALMEYKQLSLTDAAGLVIKDKLTALGGIGGLIAIDSEGNIAMPYNSEGMYRGYRLSNGHSDVKIWEDK